MGRVFALNMDNPDLIPGIAYGLCNKLGVISQRRARYNPEALASVTPKRKQNKTISHKDNIIYIKIPPNLRIIDWTNWIKIGEMR